MKTCINILGSDGASWGSGPVIQDYWCKYFSRHQCQAGVASSFNCSVFLQQYIAFSLNEINASMLICEKLLCEIRTCIALQLCYDFQHLSLQQQPWVILITGHFFCYREQHDDFYFFRLKTEFWFVGFKIKYCLSIPWTLKCCWPAKEIAFIFHDCSPL